MFENKTYQPLKNITVQTRKTKRGAKVCSRARTRPSKEFPAEKRSSSVRTHPSISQLSQILIYLMHKQKWGKEIRQRQRA